jgi:aminomethyltransferase
MKKANYAGSHPTLNISAKRFEHSPYAHCYADDKAIWGVYAKRFYPLSLGEDPVERYWDLRQKVVLYDVPERPIEISGPDAPRLLERIFCRPVAGLALGRARYAIACLPDGGVLMDGVLIRLAEERFWYVQADGEFDTWLLAHSAGLAVTIRDPRSWVLQVQGPRSLDVLAAASDTGLPDKFGYFQAGQFRLGGQDLLVTRSGWTGELGFEVYTNGGETDGEALWRHLMAAGAPFGIVSSALESMGIRRIEAGILDNGTDIDQTMTPFEAGLGRFVNLDKSDFIGREALLTADQRPLLHGLTCPTTTPLAGLEVARDGQVIGRLTTGAWSPYLERGVGYLRLDHADHDLVSPVTVIDHDGAAHASQIVALPFYDAAKKIPRGLDTTIPRRPA